MCIGRIGRGTWSEGPHCICIEPASPAQALRRRRRAPPGAAGLRLSQVVVLTAFWGGMAVTTYGAKSQPSTTYFCVGGKAPVVPGPHMQALPGYSSLHKRTGSRRGRTLRGSSRAKGHLECPVSRAAWEPLPTSWAAANYTHSAGDALAHKRQWATLHQHSHALELFEACRVRPGGRPGAVEQVVGQAQEGQLQVSKREQSRAGTPSRLGVWLQGVQAPAGSMHSQPAAGVRPIWCCSVKLHPDPVTPWGMPPLRPSLRAARPTAHWP